MLANGPSSETFVFLVGGSAFQEIARLDASKLKHKDGVKYLVEALGGQWGQLAEEEKLQLFERAIFQTFPDYTEAR